MEVIVSPVIRVLNHLIRGESWAQARLSGHSGARVRIDSGVFVASLGIDEFGLFHSLEDAVEPDVSITLPSDLVLRVIFDRGALFTSVKLLGSADIAESLAFVLRNLRWDAEADLASIIGDIAARRVARLAVAIATGIQDAINRVAVNFSEYAIEESQILTAGRDVSEFFRSVSILRDDVARLEKRISRL